MKSNYNEQPAPQKEAGVSQKEAKQIKFIDYKGYYDPFHHARNVIVEEAFARQNKVLKEREDGIGMIVANLIAKGIDPLCIRIIEQNDLVNFSTTIRVEVDEEGIYL